MEQNTQKIKRSVKGTRLAVITAIILAVLILLNVGVSLLPRTWSNFVADYTRRKANRECCREGCHNLNTAGRAGLT